jgi:hypothetical protein
MSRARHGTVRSPSPPLIALAVATPLTLAYLLLAPPAADLAAATYRSELFARAGFTAWDTGWYAAHGHWLPAYSLLSPALGALLGVRVLLALCALTASVLFALISERCFGKAAGRVAAATFALGVSVGMLSGRVPFYLGVALGLGSVLSLMHGRLLLALVLAAVTSVSSPVAGAFLALAGLAHALRPKEEGAFVAARRSRGQSGANDTGRGTHEAASAPAWLGIAIAVAALGPALALSLAYPEGGYEPFAPSAFWPALAGVLAIALLAPQGPLSAPAWRSVRAGAALYALALAASFALHTPMGGNAARLGPLLAAPLMAGMTWERRRLALLCVAPLLLYWQLATPVRDLASIAGDPSVHASYYAPLRAELRRLPKGIVEVPLTKAHWEAAYLAGHDGVRLARGWERQLDTRYGALFYKPNLTAAAYERWLRENRVGYVALPDAPLDKAGQTEGALVGAGVPYLREIWRARHWRLYRLIG